MVDVNSFLQIFVAVSILGVFLSFVINVSIGAIILRYFTQKYKLPQEYGKAWLAVFIPSLIILFLAVPAILIELPNFLLIILSLLFFPILIFSIKLVYKTEPGIAAAISLKLFLFSLALMIIAAGFQTIFAFTFDPIEDDVPQSTCNVDCEFARSADPPRIKNFTMIGYNIPSGKYSEKEEYILVEKFFDENEIKNMPRGVDGKIIGKLDANNCNYISGMACQGYSKNFFINFVNILTELI